MLAAIANSAFRVKVAAGSGIRGTPVVDTSPRDDIVCDDVIQPSLQPIIIKSSRNFPGSYITSSDHSAWKFPGRSLMV